MNELLIVILVCATPQCDYATAHDVYRHRIEGSVCGLPYQIAPLINSHEIHDGDFVTVRCEVLGKG